MQVKLEKASNAHMGAHTQKKQHDRLTEALQRGKKAEAGIACWEGKLGNVHGGLRMPVLALQEGNMTIDVHRGMLMHMRLPVDMLG